MQPTASPSRGGDRRGLVIGRVGGAPIVVRAGWLVATVLLAFIAAPVARRALPELGVVGGYLVGVGFAFLLLGSVLLHELAHAFVARRRGVPVRQVVLTLVGGHTEMGQAATPGTSALIAVAGPLANLAVAAVAWWAWHTVSVGGVPALLLVLVASSNAVVTGFNLLPGLPMDGGWILEALVWRVTGRRSTGTVVAAWIGRVVAVTIIGYALVWPGLRGEQPRLTEVVWAVVVGAMLWTGAGDFLRAVGWQDAVADFTVVGHTKPVVQVREDATLADLPSDRAEVVVVGRDGRLIGYVDRAALAHVPRDRRAGTSMDAVLIPLPPGAVVGHLTGRDALRAISEVSRVSAVMTVRGPDGAITGLLRYADVIQALRQGS